MDNAIYISLARQGQLFRTVDVVANNVANANTTGYKKESMLFTEFLQEAGRSPEGNSLNHDISFSYDVATARNLSNGAISITGKPLDVAIEGSGYFAVGNGENTFYTRVGAFSLNPQGQLITGQGELVQGVGGAPITFVNSDSEVTIAENGLITARSPEGIRVARGQIQPIVFADERQLQKVDNTRFTAPAGVAPIPALETEYKIVQGALEGSNVNPTTELTRLITATRSAQGVAQTVNDLDSLQRDMVSRLTAPAR